MIHYILVFTFVVSLIFYSLIINKLPLISDYLTIKRDFNLISPYFICLYSKEDFNLTKDKHFKDIYGCKDSLASLGYYGGEQDFLDSFCNLFFPNQDVYLKLEAYKAIKGEKHIHLRKVDFSYITVVDREKVGEWEKYCSRRGHILYCYDIVVPSFFVNEEGVVNNKHFYKFKICKVLSEK